MGVSYEVGQGSQSASPVIRSATFHPGKATRPTQTTLRKRRVGQRYDASLMRSCDQACLFGKAM